MDISAIIRELNKMELLEKKLPEGHHINRREREKESWIQDYRERSPSLDYEDKYEDKDVSRFPRIEETIFIEDGDLEKFPDLEHESIDKEIKKEDGDGIDVLAWYRSFHWQPTNKWGIYILDKGLYHVAEKVFGRLKQVSPQGIPYNMLDLLQQAFKLLFLHEFFHFITDIAASTFEIAANLKLRNQAGSFYCDYINKVYMNPSSGDGPVEEALANAYALDRFTGRDIKKSLRIFMKSQPRGYNSYNKYGGDKFRKGKRLLSTQICGFEGTCDHGCAPLEIVFNSNNRDIFWGDVPIYIVKTIKDSRYSIKFVSSIKKNLIEKSSAFERDLRRLPEKIVHKYEKTLDKFDNRILASKGLHFEKLKGCNTVFTVRLTKAFRLSLCPKDNGKWMLLRIGTHDDVYKNPS